jgi:hypothetical protein
VDIERTTEEVRRILEAAEVSAAQIRGQAAKDVARVEQELGRLLDDVRTSGERLTEGIARLQNELAGPRVAEPEEVPTEPPAAEAARLDGDEAGARLTALNMALGGTPREETARYLAEHYALADPEALLDDVYERAGA